MQQCTLYLTLASDADFPSMLESFLPGWSFTGDAASGTVVATKRRFLAKQTITFSIRSRAKDGEDFDANMRGMHSFFSAVESEKGQVKSAVLVQIQVFTTVVGVVAEKNMDDATFGALLALCAEGHGLALLPPGDLYDSRGNLVFDTEGASDLDHYTVTAPAALLDQQVKVTASGEKRKARTNALLASQGVPLCAGLPAIESEEDFVPRSQEEVAARTMAILLTSVYAELYPKEGGEQARAFVAKMLEQYSAEPFLSPEERAFLDDPAPAAQTVTNFTWRYECAWVGMWALGFVEELAYPDAICDVSGMASSVRECGDYQTFLARAVLREPTEILDQADIIYRYDWACVDARINGREAPAGLASGVVMERHRMLNWLVRYMDAEWDDVTMDT